MSDSRSPDEDLTVLEPPPQNERERSEVTWLLERENNPEALAPSPEVANDYAELERLLQTLPEGDEDDSWQEELVRRVAAVRPTVAGREAGSSVRKEKEGTRWRQRPVRLVAGGLFAALVVVLIAIKLPRRSADEQSRIMPVLVSKAPMRGSSRYSLEDTIRIRERPSEQGDLRVFRLRDQSAISVAQCPGGLGCQVERDGTLVLDYKFAGPGDYIAVFVDGRVEAPSDASLEVFLHAATTANLKIKRSDPMTVR